MMRNRRLAWQAVRYAERFIGTRYHFGDDESRGDDPVGGFDCSGLVCEVLRSIGLIGNRERLSAQGLFQRFHHEKSDTPVSPAYGVLVFFGKNVDRITHVAIHKNQTTIIEAGGGARTTKDESEAARRNAFVRERPAAYRSDLVGHADPFILE